jgi:SNF2 family DNA or RNA helicase
MYELDHGTALHSCGYGACVCALRCRSLVTNPISRGNIAGSRRLRAVLRPIMWRSTKADAARDHPLPPRTVHHAFLNMPPEEQTFYQHILGETLAIQCEVNAAVATGMNWDIRGGNKGQISAYGRAKRAFPSLSSRLHIYDVI